MNFGSWHLRIMAIHVQYVGVCDSPDWDRVRHPHDTRRPDSMSDRRTDNSVPHEHRHRYIQCRDLGSWYRDWIDSRPAIRGIWWSTVIDVMMTSSALPSHVAPMGDWSTTASHTHTRPVFRTSGTYDGRPVLCVRQGCGVA